MSTLKEIAQQAAGSVNNPAFALKRRLQIVENKIEQAARKGDTSVKIDYPSLQITVESKKEFWNKIDAVRQQLITNTVKYGFNANDVVINPATENDVTSGTLSINLTINW